MNRLSRVLAGITAGLGFCCWVPVASASIFEESFDSNPVGAYGRASWRADFPDSPWENGIDEGRVAITANGSGGTNGLRVTYPAGGVGPGDGGAQWLIPFNGNTYNELTLQYDVFFEDGFDWQLGGKLPGLVGGGSVASGGTAANGTNGWSARIMWRSNGTVAQYVYHVDQPTQFGQDMVWKIGGNNVILQDDTWYTFKTHIAMNTPGQNDGVLQSWLNGQLVLDRHDIRWRDVASLQIDNVYFSTFYGGSTAEWAPNTTTNVRFDSFSVVVPEPAASTAGAALLLALLGSSRRKAGRL
jgi:hypothetical protein